MSNWTYVYDKDFAHVYDKDHDERIDLSWDGEHMKVAADDVELTLDQVAQLRKLLQVIERRAKKETS